MSDVIRLLEAAEADDRHAAADLLPFVCDELRKLAAARIAREQPGQTLDATALVQEVYLLLVGDQQIENRDGFFAAAAEAMRRILMDAARRKPADKRGGGLHEAAPGGISGLPETEPEKLPKFWKGELDIRVLKALEKSATGGMRRPTPSVATQRYLSDEVEDTIAGGISDGICIGVEHGL